MKSFVVVGLGRFGTEVACRLYDSGNEVLVIDSSSELVQAISDHVTHAVVGDARDKGVLRALGVADFDCAVVAIGGSLADSVLATMRSIFLRFCKIFQIFFKKTIDKQDGLWYNL